MKTILYAEDDANDIALIRMALRALRGVNMRFVRDGTEAINYLAGNGEFANRSGHPVPELIFLDIKMPGRTGLDVLAWLHAHAEFNRVPVAMVSSSGRTADVDAAYRLGANSYIVKPCRFDELRRVLLKAINFHLIQTPEERRWVEAKSIGDDKDSSRQCAEALYAFSLERDR